MSTEPDPQLVREIARNIVLDHAKDVEYLSIGEHLADFDEFSSLPEDESERLQGALDKAIRSAVVTVSWPDEPPLCLAQHADGHRCLLEPGHDGRHAVRTDDGTVEWEDEKAQIPTGGFPADRLAAWLDHARRNHSAAMTPALLADLRELLAEHQIMTDHLVECPAMAEEDERAQTADAATCSMPACVHPDHQRADCPDLVQAERDADVRAVAEAADVLDFVLENGYSADVVEGARETLEARFAARIAALREREQEGAAG